MKVVKLTATAREDVESARKHASAFAFLNKSPEDLKAIDRLLSDATLWEKSIKEPLIVPHYEHARAFGKAFDDTLVIYQNCLYDVRGRFTDDQRRLLVLEAVDKERQLFERLKAKFDSPESQDVKPKRHRIPESVRIGVWRRDGGCCARCGSRERLEYDHIVPLDKGGSNTVRNVELLCERHNREKGNKIQ
jgi:HNH endonuclease